MAEKVMFHRNGRVTVGDLDVGRFRPPDPSGAPWSRKPVWILNGKSGAVYQSDTRQELSEHARYEAWRCRERQIVEVA